MSSEHSVHGVSKALMHLIDSIENLRAKNVKLDGRIRSEINENIEDMIECVERICEIVKSDTKMKEKDVPSDL